MVAWGTDVDWSKSRANGIVGSGFALAIAGPEGEAQKPDRLPWANQAATRAA